MTVKEYMIQFALQFAADNSHGYTNNYPENQWWRGTDLDCGSFMSLCLHQALLQIGIDTGHEYFEPMGSSGLYNEGFLLRYCDKYDYDTVNNTPGDILVSSGHTEMYTAPGQLTGARDNYDGKEHDYTYGTEVNTSSFYNGGWKWIFRLKDKYNKVIDESGGLDMGMIPEVKKGDSGNVVLSYQYLMRYKLGFDKQPCDGHFDDRMDYNVRFYQDEHDLYVDGIIGEQTGYTMIVETGYEEP